MCASPIRTEIKGIAGFITLSRPEQANAYTTGMIEAMDGALDALVDDPSVRLIVFQGAGGYFCAGADLKEVRSRTAKDAAGLKSAALFDKIAGCAKPTLAVIDGPAVGGGLELALACDVRIGTANARFAFPETALGLIPAAGGTLRLPLIAGPHLAKQMILFGRELDGREAEDHGILAEAATPDTLPDRLRHWIEQINMRDSQAIFLAKRAIDLAMSEQAAAYAEFAQGLLYDRQGKQPD